MALIARIDGAKLYMYHNDHPPPHFHVLLAEHRAVFDIRTLRLTRGWLPVAKRTMIVQWARVRIEKLLDAWDVTQANLTPGDIR